MSSYCPTCAMHHPPQRVVSYPFTDAQRDCPMQYEGRWYYCGRCHTGWATMIAHRLDREAPQIDDPVDEAGMADPIREGEEQSILAALEEFLGQNKSEGAA